MIEEYSKESLQKEYEACDEIRQIYEELFQTRGWARIKRIAADQLNARKRQMAGAMPRTLDESLALSGASWESAGISLMVSIPETEYVEIKERMLEIQTMLNEEEDEDE